MPKREFNRSLSYHSDGVKKRMERTTQSSNQSTPDFVRLSSRSTPENPGLPREMQPSDRARTSDGSRSRSEKLLLKMMTELRRLRKGLKKAYQVMSKLRQEVKNANQENDKLQNTVQEITHQWQQAHRERADLAHQLEQARRENEKLAHQLKQPHGKEEASFEAIRMKELANDVMRKWVLDTVNFDGHIKRRDAHLRAMARIRYKQSSPGISWWAFAYPNVYP